jgi:hypothetical protein
VAVLEEQIALNNGSNQGKKYTKREVIIIIIIIIVGIFLGLDTKHKKNKDCQMFVKDPYPH